MCIITWFVIFFVLLHIFIAWRMWKTDRKRFNKLYWELPKKGE